MFASQRRTLRRAACIEMLASCEVALDSLRTGYQAVVIGATGGIGSALVSILKQDPNCAAVGTLSRSGGFDLTDERTVEATASAAVRCPPELLIVATGALASHPDQPEKTIRRLRREAMLDQFALNAVGPALVLKHFLPVLPRGRRSIVALLSARVGSIADNRLGGWISYRSSKAALNQIVRTAAIEAARTRPEAVLALIHPGTVATRLSDPFAGDRDRLTPADSASRILDVLDRLGPDRSGGFFAYDGSPIVW